MSLSRVKLAILSDQGDLVYSFDRALNAVASVTVSKFNADSLKNKNEIILLDTAEEELRKVFYGDIRSSYLNPIIVIGFNNKEIFQREFPLFYDHPYNHTYLKIPFDLLELIDILNTLVPISSQSIREAICGGDSGYKGYLLKLLSHDLLKDKARCSEILIMANTYIKNKDMSKEVETIINDKTKGKEWLSLAENIGMKLYARIKEGES